MSCVMVEEEVPCWDCNGVGWIENEETCEIMGFCRTCRGTGAVHEPAYPSSCYGCSGCYEAHDTEDDGEID